MGGCPLPPQHHLHITCTGVHTRRSPSPFYPRPGIPCRGYYAFEPCSMACGRGVQVGTYVVTAPAQFGGACPLAGSIVTQPCNTQPCGVSVSVGACVCFRRFKLYFLLRLCSAKGQERGTFSKLLTRRPEFKNKPACVWSGAYLCVVCSPSPSSPAASSDTWIHFSLVFNFVH